MPKIAREFLVASIKAYDVAISYLEDELESVWNAMQHADHVEYKKVISDLIKKRDGYKRTLER